MSEIVVQGTTPGIRVSGSGANVTVKVTTGSGGGGGVTDHNALTGRSDPDQHPIAAVTGLRGALDSKVSTSDQRLSDARTPTAHAASHATGGTDQITPAAINARPAGNVDWSEIDNKPSIPAAQVNSDWTASSGVAQILHKPTIPSTPGDVGAAPAVRTVGTGLATSGTVNLDMAAVHGTIQTIALSGAVTFTTSNRAAGREVTLVLSAGGSPRTLTWPSWLVVGAALPTTLASGKTAVVTATCTDTTDAAMVAAGAVQS